MSNIKTKVLSFGICHLCLFWILCFGICHLSFAQETVSISDNPNNSGSTSELISLDLKGVDLLELFRMLSLKTGLNIVPTKSVSGRVNLFINNVAFEDVLDIILVTNDLAQERKGNIIKVMTTTEYEMAYGKKYDEKRKVSTIKLNYARPKDVATALDNLKGNIGKVVVDEASGTLILIDIPENLDLMQTMARSLDQPLVSEIFELNYAKAEDVQEKVNKILSSPAHTLQIDKRTNKIMVTDLSEKMEEIGRMIKEFDEASRQVLIETDIWELSLTDRFRRGVDWERIFTGIKDLDFKGRFPLGLVDTATSVATRQEISIGTVSRDHYNAVIQFLSTYGKTEILSRPRIAVVNNEEAKILIGTKEAYITTTLSQAESSTTTSESVQFIDVGVKLNVVPIINKDGFITMKIKPEVSSVTDTLTTTQGSRVPIVSTSEVETTVKVKDGTTIMIAGLIKETKTETTTGIPVLSKIPVLGWLFGKYERGPSSGAAKSELIVCITPRIISGEAGSFAGISKQ